MDTQQIERSMRERRAAIDAKLDLLANRATMARRRAMPALIVGTVAFAAVLWMRRRSVKRNRIRAFRNLEVVA